MAKRESTDARARAALKGAEGALAAAGHFVKSEEVRKDTQRAVKGEMTFDEAVRRAAARAKR